MRLRATELAGSAVVGAAGAQVAGQLRGRLLGRRQTGHHVQSDQIRIDLLANAHKGLDHHTADFTAQPPRDLDRLVIAAASAGVMLATEGEGDH
jgi:hypothetical protein